MNSSVRLKFCLSWILAVAAVPLSCPATAAVPTVFAPGVISGTLDDASPAFAPDGKTVFFMRGSGGKWHLLESHFVDGHWSAPRTAAFSGRWNDQDPAMAPDGSFLVFTSNRPVTAGGKALDAVGKGKIYPGWGRNLWRVERQGEGWSAPARLPATINMGDVVFAPSVAGDNSLYFMARKRPDDPFRLFRSQYRDSRYLPPVVVTLGGPQAVIRDPAVAPDESFIVFSMSRSDSQQPPRLAIAFREHDGWGTPVDLGDGVNDSGYALGAQLGPDHRTLYFYSQRSDPAYPSNPSTWNNGKDNIWSVSLRPWLATHHAVARKAR